MSSHLQCPSKKTDDKADVPSLQDFGGFYDRDKLFWREIHDVILSAACAPPGGGRNPVTPRLIRHFAMLTIPSPNEHSLKHMFLVS